MKSILFVAIIASLPIFAHAADPVVTQCDISFRVHGGLFRKKYDIYKDAVSITQQNSAIMNEKEGLRGFNRNNNFTLTFNNDKFGLESGTFGSTGNSVEGSKRDSKRVIHSSLVESAGRNRLAEFISHDDAVAQSSFSARITILSATESPGVKIYDVDCHNVFNP